MTVGAVQSVTNTGLYLATQHGYFAAEGLRPNIVAVSGSGPVMNDLLNGALDVSAGNYASFIAAQAAGAARLRLLAEGGNGTAHEEEVVVLPDSPIRSVPDLRGQTVGLNALVGVAQLIISSVLKEHGVPLSSVHFTAIPFPSLAPALAARRIDAAWLVEPFLTQAVVRYGVRSVIDGSQGATRDFPISGLGVTDRWATRYPRTAAAFARAVDRGQQLADQDRAAITQVLPHYIKISDSVAARVVTGTFPTAVHEADIQRVADVMYQVGMLKHPFSVAPMVG